MVCRKFYLQLTFRVILLVLVCFLFFYITFRLPNISLIIIAGALVLIQVAALIRYLNRINRKLENFFLAHLSGEVNTSFGKSGRKDEFSKLYDYFKLINEKLEKARIENEIRNNYFKAIVDQTTIGLISFTDESRVEFMNDAARRIFKVFVVRTLDKLDSFKEGLGKYLLELEPEKTELISVVVDDELVQLSVKKVDLKAGNQKLHLVSLQNIKAELDQKEMESWQKLIRVLTHEIMNSITPITSLVNSISRMFRNKETGKVITPGDLTAQALEKTVKGLDLVEGRGAGLIQFVNNYRDVNKLPKPHFQVVNMKDLFNDVQLLFVDQLTEKKINVVVSCHPSLNFRADRKLLEQVLINLFKNAIEACEEKQEPMIKLSGHTLQDKTVIEVEDNGKGVPTVVDDNMFVPFFTTKEKGSGIGLSLSRQIIRLHGGNIDYYSVPGEKTIFTIKL
jgi:two-component system, NtrC family, nitrogen regulation sensor histidine kinase NtrY